MTCPRTKALAIQIDAPGRMPGVHWQMSLYLDDGSELPFPVAVAWLSDYTGSALDCVMLDFVLVPDEHRRHGYASELIRVCERRWANLELTDAISEAGEGLLASLEKGA